MSKKDKYYTVCVKNPLTGTNILIHNIKATSKNEAKDTALMKCDYNGKIVYCTETNSKILMESI